MSLAIADDSIIGSRFKFPRALISALRSDGLVFQALTAWPRSATGDPTFPFTADTVSPPPGLRSIAWVEGSGLFGVTTSGELFLRTATGWVNQQMGPVVVMAGSSGSGGLWLWAAVDSQSVGGLGSTPATRLLPQPLTRANSTTLDPNGAFTVGLGQATPLAIGRGGAFALVAGGCPPAPPRRASCTRL